MQRDTQWNVQPASAEADDLARRLRVSPLIAQVLLNRGFSETDACYGFLQPSLKALHDPSMLANMQVAAERIARAIRDRELIYIYGDYDVDGITASAILWHAIRRLGGQAACYVPHRIEEGYGLNSEAIATLCKQGAKLIVTVDCGVTAMEPARVARECGVDLIITDHHEWRTHPVVEHSGIETASNASGDSASDSDVKTHAEGAPLLPDCVAVVHPRLPAASGVAYPNPHLCGAGVAFKLAWGIGQAVSGTARVDPDFRAFLVDAMALTALGTIADVVPLVGENRILAHAGLCGLRQSKLVGLQALIASAGLTGEALDGFHVGFLLAPRLNACGRMGHAARAVEMLTSATEPQAIEIAEYLEQQNRERQAIEREILEQALQQVAEHQWNTDAHHALVLGREGWHPGVIGIVASRIVERFHRPTIMIALNNGHGQGSGRSISGFHLAHALQVCTEHLETHGGHEMAAGLRLESGRLDAFREAFCAHAAATLSSELLVGKIAIDSEATLSQLTPGLVAELGRLGPFGHGNRKPLFVCRDLSVAAPPRRVGKRNDHLQLQVRQGDRVVKCIGFNKGEWADQLRPGVRIDVVGEPTENNYNGRVSVELNVKDLRMSTAAIVA